MNTKINHLICLKGYNHYSCLDDQSVPNDIQLHDTASPEHDLLISSSTAFVTHLLLTEYHKDVAVRPDHRAQF
jgi:hypothetical protein